MGEKRLFIDLLNFHSLPKAHTCFYGEAHSRLLISSIFSFYHFAYFLTFKKDANTGLFYLIFYTTVLQK